MRPGWIGESINRVTLRTFIFLGLCLSIPVLVNAVLPLRDQWRAACHDLSAGQATSALARFREFDQWYGREPFVAEVMFKRRKIRLWGLAALFSGELAEALPLLEEWLATGTPEDPMRAYIRFQVAMAYRAMGDDTAAVRHWDIFIEEHPTLPECALVHWMRADLLVAQSRFDEACQHLEQVLQEERLPLSGRALASAALSLASLSGGDSVGAAAHLSRLAEGDDLPVLHLWRALLAPSLVTQLLQEHPGEALRVSAWFDRPDNLQQIIEPLTRNPQIRPSGLRHVLWTGHWQDQLGRLEGAARHMNPSATPVRTLFLLRMEVLEKAEMPASLLALARFLLASPTNNYRAIRADCYASAIRACLAMELWDQANSLAQGFLEEHPDDPDLPDILFLKARIAAQRKDPLEAHWQVTELIKAYPDNPSMKAWQLSAAGWQLDSGDAAPAHEAFLQLEADCPLSWKPYIRFQRAKCMKKLQHPAEADALMKGVAFDGEASGSLREQAFTSLLGWALRQSDETAFNRLLGNYRETFPDGLNRLFVENLAGTSALLSGNVPVAIQHFSAVAREPHPVAALAHDQLSSIYRSRNDMAALRRHAIDWIRQSLQNGEGISSLPFIDCHFYQNKTGQSALPPAMLDALMERLFSADPHFPGEAFLRILESQWMPYARLLGFEGMVFERWLEKTANDLHMAGNWLPFSHFRLFEAWRLDQAGRNDSADTRRIEVLSSIDPGILGEEALFTVTSTADKFDFPEAATSLQDFLNRYPESRHVPDILYQLALRRRSSGQPSHAIHLLQNILDAWADAAIHITAGRDNQRKPS
jgi:tetratricopeptide (TPR) repeat protein